MLKRNLTLADYADAKSGKFEMTAEEMAECERILAEFSDSLAPMFQAFSEALRPGTPAGDIWVLLRRDATEEEKLRAAERLAEISISNRDRKAEERTELLAAVYAAVFEEESNPRSRREIVIKQTPADALRVLKLRVQEELRRMATGRGRGKVELNELPLHEHDGARASEITLSRLGLTIESEILIREALQQLPVPRKYLAAIIEAELFNYDLKEIAELRELSYDNLRQLKSRHKEKIQEFFR